MGSSTNDASMPLRLSSSQDFSLVRSFFREAGFDSSTVCRLLGMDDMSELQRISWEKVQLDGLSVQLRCCLNVFLRGLPLPESDALTAWGKPVCDSLLSLGLLRHSKQNQADFVSPVWLYPAEEFILASDRTTDPDGGVFNPAPDVVFPAIYGGTLRFLRLLPGAHDGEALDLCGGSGIGAFRLAHSASAAITADLTARSAFFAEFNARLNNLPVQSLCGDLYEPVAGRQFDLITAHPPFVPATGSNMVYRDGGESGEEVTRRIIEGLPQHLRVGGTCVVLCVARDTQEGPFEQRIRQWLGSAAGEFDVLFGLEKVLTVVEVVESLRARGQNLTDEAAHSLASRLQSLGTRQFVYGALFLRRYLAPVKLAPFRIGLTPGGRAGDFERLFKWRRHRLRAEFDEWLRESSPWFAPHLQLTARHIVHEGELVPAEFVFTIADGLEAALRPDAWIVPLLARLNGKRSVREVHESAVRAEELPQGFRLEDFAGLVSGMIERGFLQVDVPDGAGDGRTAQK